LRESSFFFHILAHLQKQKKTSHYFYLYSPLYQNLRIENFMQSLNFMFTSFIKVMDEVEVDEVVGTAVIFTGARVALLTLLAYFGAWTVNSGIAICFAVPPAALFQQTNTPRPSPQSQLPLAAYAIVHSRDIFNSVKSPVQVGVAQVAATTTALKLWGTAKNGLGPAFAIIKDPSTRIQKLYGEGETIAPGIRLLSVDWDHVVIERNGRQETLALSALSTQTSGQKNPHTRVAIRGKQTGNGTVRKLAQDTFQLERREIEHAMNNLGTLFKQVRAVPYATKDGVPQGFRLFSIKANSLIDRLGVKNGDIVQRVNGVEISDPSTAFSLLQDVQGQSRVQIDVMRNHQPVTLSYEIH